MTNVSGKIALVTGAASGIGRETAEALAREGASVVVCDVHEEKLADVRRTLGSACAMARVVDVGSADAMRAFAGEVHAQVGVVDVLVNNAGVGLMGGLLGTSLADWEWVLRVNLWGVIHGCHFFVPPMVDRGKGGHVVNVSSTFGFFAAADVIGYATSKFGVFGFTESLRGELAPHGIGVSVVCPGVVATDIIAGTRFAGDGEDAAARRSRAATLFSGRAYGPEKVARAILDAVANNTSVAPVSPEAWALYYLKRLVPGVTGPLGRFLTKQAAG